MIVLIAVTALTSKATQTHFNSNSEVRRWHSSQVFF